jgi:hypothetical protein
MKAVVARLRRRANSSDDGILIAAQWSDKSANRPVANADGPLAA